MFKAIVDIIILAASSYLMIKKIWNFSLSTWLLDNYFQKQLIDLYLVIFGLILLVAIVSKMIIILFDSIPPEDTVAVDPDEISECIGAINREIVEHLHRCENGELTNIKTLCEQHTFDKNIRIVVTMLGEHIRRSVKSNLKKKDVFISLYSYDENKSTLSYELHYDSKRDLVKSKTINLNEVEFLKYESVKCMNSSSSTIYVFEKDKYAKGHSKRNKTIEHYMGCKLEANGYVFGFLNIEFHNHILFNSEDEMQGFMESNVFPYKLFLEYQYLKKRFFLTFKNFEECWRLT